MSLIKRLSRLRAVGVLAFGVAITGPSSADATLKPKSQPLPGNHGIGGDLDRRPDLPGHRGLPSPIVHKNLRVAVTLLALTGLAVLSGCQDGDGGNEGRVPRLTTSDSIYLENPFTQQLTVYDRQSHRVVASSGEDDYFYYGFNPPSKTYTAGSSTKLGFSILQIDDHEVTELRSAPKDSGYFPLASSGTFVFLTQATYNAEGSQVGNAIVQMETSGNISKYFDVEGTLDSGAIVDGWLYYSAYNAETELYDVYSFQIGNHSLSPRLYQSGLTHGNIYAHEGRVLTMSDEGVVDGENTFPCTDLCYFYDQPNVVVKMAPDADAGLALTVYDGATGAEIERLADVVGFAVDGDGVRAYCDGSEKLVTVDGS